MQSEKNRATPFYALLKVIRLLIVQHQRVNEWLCNDAKA